MSKISKIKQRLFDSVKKPYKKGTPVKFAPKPEKPKTPPGKNIKKAGGGKVVYRKHNGKVDKVMSGNDLVASCYD